mmetsp:Transcript_3577/g.10461  ORF Transcript_3577/g.10461 Transcript_3577/m.10461 type:complete len:801 (-) Transcript_3577:87-2489(-)
MGCNQSSAAGSSAGNGGGKKPEQGDRSKDRKAAASENKEYQAKMEFLARVPLMKRLPKDQHPLVASACVVQDFAKGATVIKQGEDGDEFFVIRTGQASVLVKDESGGEPKKVATLEIGDYFGENALLRDETRMATVTAETALSTYKIKRDKFRELGLHERLQFATRRAVGGGGQQVAKAQPPSPKTPDESKLIAQAIRDNENLSTIAALDDAKVKSFIDVMWKEEVAAGQEIIAEGDLQADYFYVVQSGSFDISVSDGEKADGIAGADAQVVGTVSKGGSFGELALLYFVPRAATVKAKENSTVWVIDRGNFKNVLMKVSDTKLREYAKYLDGVSILSALLAEEKKELAKALVEMHFTRDELVIQQGEPGNTFYILYDGQVSIEKDGAVVGNLSASVSRATAQYFGEGALLDNETRGATVKVTSDTAKTLVLDRDAFNLLLGPLKDIIERQRQGGTRTSMAGKGPMGPGAPAVSDKPRDKILRKDLVRIGLLGCGGFGTVELFEHKVTKETYAMKGLSKGYIVKTGMQDSVMNEKNILMMTNSDFIIKLWETYNGTQSLYFLLEPALGGELYATYNRKGLHGSERHCKYYIAGTVYAFEHLHERRIIYRDLKPENLLLTDKGHIKLTDMGLAKFVIGKTFTTCGTPDYFAPEVIASTGHTNAVDWWTLGILCYELMSGHPPFESPYPMQIYAKVTKGIGKITFPAKVQGPVADLVRQLLKNDPSERLPMRPGGVANLRGHKWFDGFDWDAMKALKLDAPYKPVVKSKKDLANFSARKEDMPKMLDYHDPGTGWDKKFATA